MSRLDWRVDGRSWPNAAHSRFLRAGNIDWHVQVMGAGPPALLLHGLAASTHTFRHLAPSLAEHFTVVVPDLPGHAFTRAPAGEALSLPGMRDGVAALLDALGLDPAWAIGHSAGAAILVRMALDGRLGPRRIVALNGALLPFGGTEGMVAPVLARMLALNPFAPRLFAALAGRESVKRLIAGMGSRLDREGLALYTRLMSDPRHVAGALDMMAAWDLDGLGRDLPGLAVPLTAVVGTRDRAVPPDAALRQLARLLPGLRVHRLEGLGHLVHEERPDLVAALLAGLAAEDGLWPAPLTPAAAAPGSAATPTS